MKSITYTGHFFFIHAEKFSSNIQKLETSCIIENTDTQNFTMSFCSDRNTQLILHELSSSKLQGAMNLSYGMQANHICL